MTDIELREQITRIDNLREEALKFAAEQRKLSAEARKLDRDHAFAPWQMAVVITGAGAALFTAALTALRALH